MINQQQQLNLLYCLYRDKGKKHVVMFNDSVNLTLYDDEWAELITTTASLSAHIRAPGAADRYLQADAEPPWRHCPTPQSARHRLVLPG